MNRNFLTLLLVVALAAPVTAQSESCDSSCDDGACKVVIAMPCDPCDTVVTSRTHFTDRPLFGLCSPERESLYRNRAIAREDGCQSAVQAVIFGGRTTDRGRMATYFTPFGKSELRVKSAGDLTFGERDADVLVEYFNVFVNNQDAYKSIIRFAPRQSVVGGGFTFDHRFAECEETGRAFTFNLAFSVQRVKNTMGFSETIINDGGGVLTDLPAGVVVAGNMEEAFKQASWECGKIDCACEKAKTRLASIEANVGYEVLNHDTCKLESYFGISLPTGNKVRSTFLYEPIIGQEKHVGLMFGTKGSMHLWDDEARDASLTYHFHISGQYLVRNKQHRLIDIVNKPWSRFMRMYKDRDQALLAITNDDPFLYTPGVNILCRSVKVKPGFTRTFNTALTYERCNVVAEAGYTFFARPDECVELECPWEPTAAIISVEGSTPGNVDRVQQINDNFDGLNNSLAQQIAGGGDLIDYYNDHVITECDLDLVSAAHPCMTSHTVYGTLGYKWDDREYPILVATGGSYEFGPHNNTANRWTIWAKAGLSW
ncbi:MAG TPA: hypothetical protein VGT41_04765 [Candidatus Babeliales bacterium]|nr:hypothetical protein [Candidatus Babeliales bacterium]